MIKYFTLGLFFISFTFSLGLKALVIPQNSIVLSLSGTGIAGNIAAELNPASLANIKPYLSFSRNNWYGDLKGQKISSLFAKKNKSYVSFESLSVDDIELRDEIASDTPLGFFGAYWYALDFSQSIDIPQLNSLSFGYKLKANLSRLYDETMYGVTADIGIIKNLKDNLSIGFIIKNFGKEYKSSLNADTPLSVGFGLSYHIPKAYLHFLADIIYQDDIYISKNAIKTSFPYVNLLFGSSNAKDYNDFSMGIIIEIKEWSIIYGTLNHDNDLLGSPKSFELRKYF